MAEPFLLRPWEIGELTDKQIRLMIAGQNKATESVGGKDGPKAMDEVPETKIGDKEFVTETEAKAFMKSVDETIYGS
jgi:hypothetical protein